jgi:hypothetical protein
MTAQQRCTGGLAQQWTPLDSGDYQRFRNGLVQLDRCDLDNAAQSWTLTRNY